MSVLPRSEAGPGPRAVSTIVTPESSRIAVLCQLRPCVNCGSVSTAASRPVRYRRPMDDDEQFAVSYQGVSPGVPVLTKDGTQFGILEHVLEVPEEDVFDGIVVWTGGGGWLDRRVPRDPSRGAETGAPGGGHPQ